MWRTKYSSPHGAFAEKGQGVEKLIMNSPVIVSAVRTAVGKAPKGTLSGTRPDDMAAVAMRAAIERTPGLGGDDLDDIYVGCAMPEAEQGMNVARVAAF